MSRRDLVLCWLASALLLTQEAIAEPSAVCVRQVTRGAEIEVPRVNISRDGGTLAFESSGDLTGDNPDLAQRVYVVKSDGTGLRHLPVLPPDMGCSPTISAGASMSADGSKVMYHVNTCPNAPLISRFGFHFVAFNEATNPDALQQPLASGGFTGPWLAANASTFSFLAGSPSVFHAAGMFVADLQGNSHQVSPYDGTVSGQITGNGAWVFFHRLCGSGVTTYRTPSDGAGPEEPLGGCNGTTGMTPSDSGDRGVFTQQGFEPTYLGLWEAGHGTRVLVPGDSEFAPRHGDLAISGDGRFVLYIKQNGPTGFGSECRIVRRDIDTGAEIPVVDRPDVNCGSLATTADGSTIAFRTAADLTGDNPSGTQELFIAAVGAECTLSSSTTSPTTTTTTTTAPHDHDDDAVPDFLDNCPAVWNPTQDDTDSDEVGNLCDACPDSSTPAVDSFGCDCSDKTCDDALDCNGQESCELHSGLCTRTPYPDTCDRDGDGASDEHDNCPLISNSRQKDRDKDGVGDSCDNCPREKNPRQEDAGQDGIGDACEIALPPVIDSLKPSLASPGAPVIITGKHFGIAPGASSINVGGVHAGLVAWAPRELRIITPDLPEGEHDLRVTTTAGSSSAVRIVISATEATKARVRAKAASFLRLVRDALGALHPPQDWRTLIQVYGLSIDLGSYEALYVHTMNHYSLAATAGVLAKNAVDRGKVALAEKLLLRGRTIYAEAVQLQTAAADRLNGRLTSATDVYTRLKLVADLSVACLARFTPTPWLGQAYTGVNMVVGLGLGLAETEELDGPALELAIKALSLLLTHSIKEAATTGSRLAIEGRSLRSAIEVALKQPGLETRLLDDMAQCGIAMTATLARRYLDSVADVAGKVVTLEVQ